jgi:hypothetical protein
MEPGAAAVRMLPLRGRPCAASLEGVAPSSPPAPAYPTCVSVTDCGGRSMKPRVCPGVLGRLCGGALGGVIVGLPSRDAGLEAAAVRSVSGPMRPTFSRELGRRSCASPYCVSDALCASYDSPSLHPGERPLSLRGSSVPRSASGGNIQRGLAGHGLGGLPVRQPPPLGSAPGLCAGLTMSAPTSSGCERSTIAGTAKHRVRRH